MAELTLSVVDLVYEAGQDMTVLDVEIVMRTEHVSGNDSSVAAAVLLDIRPAKQVGHPFIYR